MVNPLFKEDPLYSDVTSNIVGDKDDWWEYPVLLLLLALVVGLFQFNLRGFGLVAIGIAVVAGLLWFRSTLASWIAIVGGPIIGCIYFFLVWQIR